MIDSSIQPNPIFIVLFVFEDQDDTCFFACLERIVQALPDCLCPFLPKIKLNGVGTSKTIAPGTVRQDNLCLSTMFITPFILIPFLRMLSFCEAECGAEKNYQDGNNKLFHEVYISEIMGNAIENKQI